MSQGMRYRYTRNSINVAFVFGALGASVLTGPVLIRMLRGLYIGESAARNILTKMRNMQTLDVSKTGRTPVYRLGHGLTEKYREIEGTAGRVAWDGSFHSLIYDIPERQRAFRDRFRYLAQYTGYGLIRPGVMICPEDRLHRVAHFLRERPAGTNLFTARLDVHSLREARRMASVAWDLEPLAAGYRETLGTIRRARDDGFKAGADNGYWEGFVRWNRLYQELLTLQLADPELPEELLPMDWPRSRFSESLHQLNSSWGPKIQPFLRTVAAQMDPAENCKFNPPRWGGD
ncbi:PaaX family transcriptional regulator C-terminal domain-containing protein [Saxibacter everestensis]|uniref:PaaX family transcriptional regulator C-terminal domain-containing protein n=1 Tax=Saxibacter everestensis TaxID=2909229 RepID=A0ABY8QSN8_9MICO|nr:PaaX family transcriptional regulator C-terminal domain-containing protein [Brevibacteriaceae bacterium ZFBP1038]